MTSEGERRKHRNVRANRIRTRAGGTLKKTWGVCGPRFCVALRIRTVAFRKRRAEFAVFYFAEEACAVSLPNTRSAEALASRSSCRHF